MGQRLLRAAASVKPSRSHLMMGGGSIAGLFQPCPEAIAVDTVRAALTSGITSFDTAPHYGLGVSEERIGMGMSALGNELCSPAMRDAASDRAIRELKELGAVQLWTKSGRIICAAGTPGAVLQAGGTDITGVTYYDLLTNASRERDQIFDYTAEGAARSLDASEARFGHRVAGLRVHDADTDELVDECLAPGGMLEGLRALREAGRIDSVSLGMNMVVAPQILRLLREAPAATFDNIMLAHGWNLLCQDGLEVMKECAAQGISVHNAGVYCTGLLVGGDRYFYSEAPAEVRARAESWGRISDEHGVPLASIAIKFGLMPTPVSQVVIGMGSPAEVSQSIEWAETPVPNGVWTDAVAQGLLPADVADMFDDAMQ